VNAVIADIAANAVIADNAGRERRQQMKNAVNKGMAENKRRIAKSLGIPSGISDVGVVGAPARWRR
jgi:hypothetical protein